MYVYLCLLAPWSTSYSCPHPPSVNFSDDSEHVSDEEDLPPELKEILKKTKQKKEETEEPEEGPFPQTTLERRKKVLDRKSLLSPRPQRRSEQPASPADIQATPKDESEEVKRLTARVEELEMVSGVGIEHCESVCSSSIQHST